MQRKSKNVVVSMAVSAVMGGLLFTNLSAIAAATSYGIPKPHSTSSVAAKGGTGVLAPASTTTPLRLPPDLAVLAIRAGIPVEIIPPAQSSKLDLWLEQLAWKESNGRSDIRVLDNNGRYSYGCLQFQMATFQAYTKMYGLPQATTTAGWTEKLYNCPTQKQLAKLMIQDNYANWKHWRYTVLYKGVGLPPVDLLPSLAAAK